MIRGSLSESQEAGILGKMESGRPKVFGSVAQLVRAHP